MKLLNTVLTSTVILACATANANVTGSLGGGFGTFATLSSATPGVAGTGGTLSGTVSGTIGGGAVYASDMAFAHIVVPGQTFLAAGPTPGGFLIPNTSTLTFTAPLNYISFLWGSPETFNTLTVNSTGGGSQVFTTASLSFPVQNGDPSVNQPVQFTGIGGSLITSLVFSSTQNAFEVGGFTITPVPEPESYALMLAGLGLVGFVARLRKSKTI